MKRKNSPGCKCCKCVATPGYICVCSCQIPFRSSASVGDSNGTHTLGYSLTAPIGWKTSYKTKFEIYSSQYVAGICDSDGSSRGSCKSLGLVESTIGISLIFDCANWTLNFSWQITGCYNPSTCLFVRRPCGDIFAAPYAVLSATTPVDCSNTSILKFSFPTSHPDGYPAPFGGGIITVVF